MSSSGIEPFGRFLILVGIVFLLLGAFLTYGKHFSFIGRLPGDIRFERGNFVFYFPIMTSIILSVVLSLLLYFLGRR